MKLHRAVFAALLILSNSALAADNSGPWTSGQLKKLCYWHTQSAQGDARYFDRCMKRNASKLGKQKQAGDITDLNAADARLTQQNATQKEQK